MAKIEMEVPKPKVILELTWEEFEAIAGSVARAEPTGVIEFLTFNSRNGRPELNNLQALNKVSEALYTQFTDTIQKGV